MSSMDETKDLESWRQTLKGSELLIQSNQFDYNAHVSRIQSMKKLGYNLDDVNKVREAMSCRLALAEDIWMEWIQDTQDEVSTKLQNTTDSTETKLELYRSVADLYERAGKEILSLSLWQNYISFANSTLEQIYNSENDVQEQSEIRRIYELALQNIGSHPWDSIHIWKAYFQFELEELEDAQEMIEEQDSDMGPNQTNSADVRTTQERILRIYQRWMSIPSAFGETVREIFTTWLEDNQELQSTHAEQIKHIDQSAERAAHQWNIVRLFEDQVVRSQQSLHQTDAVKNVDPEFSTSEQTQGNVTTKSTPDKNVKEDTKRPENDSKSDELDQTSTVNVAAAQEQLVNSYRALLSAYKQFESPGLIQIAYERAVSDCYWSSEFWTSYAHWARHDLGNISTALFVTRRAVRQTLVVSALWISYIELIEMQKGDPDAFGYFVDAFHASQEQPSTNTSSKRRLRILSETRKLEHLCDIDAVCKTATQMPFTDPYDHIRIWQAACDAYRRTWFTCSLDTSLDQSNTDKIRDTQKECIRQGYKDYLHQLTNRYGDWIDGKYYLLRKWALTETYIFGEYNHSCQVWDDILQMDRQRLQAYTEAIESAKSFATCISSKNGFTQQNEAFDRCRYLFKQALHFLSHNMESVEHMCALWENFEGEYGTFDSLLMARTKCSARREEAQQKAKAQEAKLLMRKNKKRHKKDATKENSAGVKEQDQIQTNVSTHHTQRANKASSANSNLNKNKKRGRSDSQEVISGSTNTAKKSSKPTLDASTAKQTSQTTSKATNESEKQDISATKQAQTKKASVPAFDTQTTLFYKNLPFSYSEDDLRHLFDTYGTVLRVELSKNSRGGSRGFGYVVFEETAATTKALDALKGHKIEKRPIFLARYAPPSSRVPSAKDENEEHVQQNNISTESCDPATIYVCNLPEIGYSEDKLKEFFDKRVGPVLAVWMPLKYQSGCGSKSQSNATQSSESIHHKGFALVTFRDRVDSESDTTFTASELVTKSLQLQGALQINGQTLNISRAKQGANAHARKVDAFLTSTPLESGSVVAKSTKNAPKTSGRRRQAIPLIPRNVRTKKAAIPHTKSQLHTNSNTETETTPNVSSSTAKSNEDFRKMFLKQ